MSLFQAQPVLKEKRGSANAATQSLNCHLSRACFRYRLTSFRFKWSLSKGTTSKMTSGNSTLELSTRGSGFAVVKVRILDRIKRNSPWFVIVNRHSDFQGREESRREYYLKNRKRKIYPDIYNSPSLCTRTLSFFEKILSFSIRA